MFATCDDSFWGSLDNVFMMLANKKPMLGEKNVTGVQNTLHLIKSLEVLIASTDLDVTAPESRPVCRYCVNIVTLLYFTLLVYFLLPGF